MEFFYIILLTVCVFSSCLHRVIKRLNDGWTNFLLHLRFAVFKCVYINDCCCCRSVLTLVWIVLSVLRQMKIVGGVNGFCWLLLTKNSAMSFFLSSFFFLFTKFVWFNCIERTKSVRLYDEFHPENLITLNWAPIVCSIETIFSSILFATNFMIKKLLVAYSLFCLGIVFLFYLRFS